MGSNSKKLIILMVCYTKEKKKVSLAHDTAEYPFLQFPKSDMGLDSHVF